MYLHGLDLKRDISYSELELQEPTMYYNNIILNLH